MQLAPSLCPNSHLSDRLGIGSTSTSSSYGATCLRAQTPRLQALFSSRSGAMPAVLLHALPSLLHDLYGV